MRASIKANSVCLDTVSNPGLCSYSETDPNLLCAEFTIGDRSLFNEPKLVRLIS